MYVGRLLSDLLDDEPVRRYGARVTRKVGEDLGRRVARRTPVARPLPHVGAEAFVRRRGGRAPGTLRESWQVGQVLLRYAGRVYEVPVFTMDPVAPHVEWDTMPHLILPKDPDGFLVFDTAEGTVWAKMVNHPGTKGAHMMATALAEVAATWQRIGKREWSVTVREWWMGGGDL